MHFKFDRPKLLIVRMPSISLFMAMLGFACFSSQAVAAPQDELTIRSFNEDSLNVVLQPIKTKVVMQLTAKKEKYFRFTYKNISIVVLPRDCTLNAKKKDICKSAFLYAQYNFSNDKILLAKKKAVAVQVAAFSRSDAFVSGYMKTDSVSEVSRFIQISNGSYVGTIRTEIGYFGKSFENMVKNYIKKVN